MKNLVGEYTGENHTQVLVSPSSGKLALFHRKIDDFYLCSGGKILFQTDDFVLIKFIETQITFIITDSVNNYDAEFTYDFMGERIESAEQTS